MSIREIENREQAQAAPHRSEERFRLVSQSVTDAIWEWDLATGRLEWFGDIDRLLGYDPGEFPRTIEAWEALIHPQDHDRVMLALDRHLTADEPYHQEYRVRRKDGSIRYWSDRGTAIRDVRAQAVRMIGSCTDITERQQAEAALREAHQRLDGIIEFLPDATFVIDRHGRVVAWNKAIEEMTGAPKADMIGKGDYQYAVPFYGERRPILIDLALLPESEVKQKYDFIHWSGDTLFGEVYVPSTYGGRGAYLWGTASRLRDAAGNVIGAIESVRDITERKRAEEEVRRTKEEVENTNRHLEAAIQRANQLAVRAEAANVAKSAFLANMSHEIRTPMTAILGFAESLLDPELPDADRLDAAQTIRRNGEHLLEIINDILDLSKIEAGKLEIEHIPFSPAQLIADVQSLMQPRAKERDLQFEARYDGPIPQTIQGDPTRIRQILVNLAGNAIKFTKAGYVTLLTRLVDHDQDPARAAMRFEVIDTGIGMTREQTGRLFRPFVQVDSSTTRRFGGTGLGLSISKRLAVMLGGDLVVESRPAQGSTFRLTIPVGPRDSLTLLDHPEQTLPSPEHTGPASGPADHTALNCNVLLAEDGPDNQRLISFVLTKAGATVTVVENGQAAVETALAALLGRRANDPPRSFDVILMDMQMPVMDGYQATSLLREKGYTRPIIALTAHAMASDRQKCLDAGCNDCASKPIDRRKLVETIRRCLQPDATRTPPAKQTAADLALAF